MSISHVSEQTCHFRSTISSRCSNCHVFGWLTVVISLESSPSIRSLFPSSLRVHLSSFKVRDALAHSSLPLTNSLKDIESLTRFDQTHSKCFRHLESGFFFRVETLDCLTPTVQARDLFCGSISHTQKTERETQIG